MAVALPAMRLDQCPWPIIWINCARCSRHTAPHVATLQRKFGAMTTLGEAARLVAARGGCHLAKDAVQNICSVRVEEPPIDHWASLDHARRFGYAGRLHCHRHLAAMKSTRPCPMVWDLDLDTLVAVLGWDFPLERLPSRLSCPDCHTKHIRIEWIAPPESPAPDASGAETVVRLKPTRAALAKKRFRVVGSGED
jgi:hypothetical protein